ncbi:MAG TPA: ABC transporter ATP-binding protein [Clostridiales bacterium]|nr:ABC transporter ATP-binding protein [Clostridiales bacterium]
MLKLFKYLKPHWKVAILGPVLLMIEVFTDLLQPTLMADIVDKGIGNGDMDFIMKTGAIMIGVAALGFLCGVGSIVASSHAGVKLGRDLREDVYKKIQTFSFSNLDKFKAPSLITRLTNDIVQIQNIVIMALRTLVRAPLLGIGGIVMVVSINAQLALIILAAIVTLVIIFAFVMKKGLPFFSLLQKRIDRLNAVTRENLTGVRVVKAFVREDTERARFHKANTDLVDVTTRAIRLVMLVLPIIMLVINLSIIAVIWFGGIQVGQGGIEVGQIMAFINYMMIILFSLIMVAVVLVMYSRAKASMDRVWEVLKTQADIQENLGASDEPIKTGRVDFQNVSFRYEGAGGDPVLKNISFTVHPGETVGILGGTGSGKTTLVSLIPRLYDVTEGRVLVDGRDVRDIKLKTLRDAIGFVLQDTVLFSGTISENIRWGKKDASDEEVMEAAKAAQAHDFVTGFKEGYNTRIEQRGVNVSGGQKQRLSIARALIKKPAILILDDSTSAVDMGTESKIQKNLKKILKTTTCIVIAQRISSVRDADKILVLDDGQIVDQGTHDQLIKTSAIYRDIYRSQMGEEALSNG